MEKSPDLHIGVDLDNTLINYDAAFSAGAKPLGLPPAALTGGKRSIKAALLARDGGNVEWERLQGQVYGRLISQARLFPGVYRFLWRCRAQGRAVDIVSHKTRYGHHDEDKVPLREAATRFLAEQGIRAGRNELVREICFADTREDKLRKIVDSDYRCFIDDLPEILADVALKNVPIRILFGEEQQENTQAMETITSWPAIEQRLLGPWSPDELAALAAALLDESVTAARWLTRGGNANLAEVATASGARFAVKLYPVAAGHDRLKSEFEGFSFIREQAVDRVPQPRRRHVELNAAAYEWIEGFPIEQPKASHLHQALDFLEMLHGMRNQEVFNDFPPASACLTSGATFERQLRERLAALSPAADTEPELSTFLTEELSPLLERTLDWVRTEWGAQPAYAQSLPRGEQTLSPSDFGFHNALERPDGKLVFLDFEYFGWDDPAKLIADFAFHPGMALSPELKQQWLAGTIRIYGEGVLPRLKRVWPMVGLSWCLILLNEFKADVWLRRCAANKQKSEQRRDILTTQLHRSRDLLHTVRDYLAHPEFL